MDNTKETAQVLNCKVSTVSTTYLEFTLGGSSKDFAEWNQL